MSNKIKHPAIRVAATKDGFRRGGMSFSTKPQTIALGSLHPDAHAQIINDPALVVVDTHVKIEEEHAAALPHADAAHVIEGTKRINEAGDHTDEHDKKIAALDELVQRTKHLDERQTELELLGLRLSDREAGIVTREQALSDREAGIVTREQALSDREAATKQHDEAQATLPQKATEEGTRHPGSAQGRAHGKSGR